MNNILIDLFSKYPVFFYNDHLKENPKILKALIHKREFKNEYTHFIKELRFCNRL